MASHEAALTYLPTKENIADLKYETSSVGCGHCLCQVLGQHWSAMRAHSTSPGSHPHWKLPHHFPPLTAASASADEAACTRQPRLRPGCHLHAVPSSDVVVAHCITTDCPLTSWLCTLCRWPFPTIHPNTHHLSPQHHHYCTRSSMCITQTHVHWTPCIVVWFLMGHIPHLSSRWWVMGGWPWGVLTWMQMVHMWMAQMVWMLQVLEPWLSPTYFLFCLHFPYMDSLIVCPN